MERNPETLRQMTARFEREIRRAGVKRTPQRMAIFREVARTGGHPDIMTVFGNVRKAMPTVSLDTVYRTLGLFMRLGLVTTVRPLSGAGPVRRQYGPPPSFRLRPLRRDARLRRPGLRPDRDPSRGEGARPSRLPAHRAQGRLRGLPENGPRAKARGQEHIKSKRRSHNGQRHEAMTTGFGAPVDNDLELDDRRPQGPRPHAGRAPDGEARPLQPRAHPRARRPRQGRRRLRLLRVHRTT